MTTSRVLYQILCLSKERMGLSPSGFFKKFHLFLKETCKKLIFQSIEE
ncbi:hypothetical protein MHI11_20685 [Bacillus sp. FSL K6-3312]